MEYADLLNQLLMASIQQQASDLHLSPGYPPSLRINGDLVRMTNMASIDRDSMSKLVQCMMTTEQWQQFEKEREFDFAMLLPTVGRFRINVFYQMHGIAAVLRIIPDKIPTLDELNLRSQIEKIVRCANGLILVTGATGSGKSTTMAAMINHINENDQAHIITIEDPIEYIHQSKRSLINQREVYRDTHHFTGALRSALREDPDVILIGEMRDLETIRLALTAAETGHLVVASLHTSSAPRTINRIIDVFPAHEKNRVRNMLAESLQAVICQTLLKSVNGSRVAAFEIMLGTTAIRNLIREDKIPQMYTVMQTNAEIGMTTLDQYLQLLQRKSVITMQVAYDTAMNKDLFKSRMPG